MAKGTITVAVDEDLIKRAKSELSQDDIERSVAAALAAAIDYKQWVRELDTPEHIREANGNA